LPARPLFGRGLTALAIVTAVTLAAGYSLVFFYARLDADQGVIQKIFYVHVPLAIVALCGFVAGGLMAIQHLRTGDRSWDMRSYVAIHLSIIFGVGVLITGSIWAKRSWGHWWVWDEPVLVSFLIVFLLYCCYQPLRFAIADRERQARYASVFAIAAGASDGLGLGDNSKAALVTRALAEMIRLGTAMGGKLPTFYGLSGAGDLILTCFSRGSRNRHVGELLGRGQSLREITSAMQMVAEGIPTTRSAYECARKLKIDTPIIDQVYALLYQGRTAAQAMEDLLGRDQKAEWN